MKRVVVVILASIACGGLLSCSGCKGSNYQPTSTQESSKPKEFVRIEGFELDRETNDGSTLDLRADVALFFAGLDRAELEGVELVYHLASGSVISAHANTGVVNTSSGSAEANGNVVIHTDYGFWFLTNFLTYDPDLKEIRAPGQFMAFGPELVINGKNLLVDLKSESFQSDGPILAQIWDLSAIEERFEQ